VLLAVFFVFVGQLAEWTRPETDSIDCARVPAADVPALERCVTIRPDDLELMAELGRAYEQAAQWDRAEALYRRAVAVDPHDGDMRVRLGIALLQRGDVSGARSEGVAALHVQPGRPGPLDLIRRASPASEAGSAR
jgi:tetratricopeptide (TPR) repeat protein